MGEKSETCTVIHVYILILIIDEVFNGSLGFLFVLSHASTRHEIERYKIMTDMYPHVYTFYLRASSVFSKLDSFSNLSA